MNRIKSLLLSVLLSVSLAMGAQQIDTAFVHAPLSVVPHIDKNSKHDLIDFFNAKRQARVKSMLDSYVELTEKRADYLKLALTPASSIELLTIPAKENDYCILVIQTVEGKAKDGSLTLYDSKWIWLDVPELTQKPILSDFLKKEYKLKDPRVANALALVPITFVWVSVEEGSTSLTFHLDLKNILDKTEWKEVAPFFNETISRKIVLKR